MVQAFEELTATGPIEAHRPRIEIGQEPGDPRVGGGEGEEGLVAEPRQNPALRDLDRDLHLRFVTCLRRPCGQNHCAVVLGEFLVGALKPRLVATGDDDPALELIAVMCRPPLCGLCPSVRRNPRKSCG